MQIESLCCDILVRILNKKRKSSGYEANKTEVLCCITLSPVMLLIQDLSTGSILQNEVTFSAAADIAEASDKISAIENMCAFVGGGRK